MPWRRLQRCAFWVCWVLWRISSPQALVVVFLTLGTLAMAQRDPLHDQLLAMQHWLIEVGQFPDPAPNPDPDATAAALDRLIALGVFGASLAYWIVVAELLGLFHWLLHAATRRLRRHRA